MVGNGRLIVKGSVIVTYLRKIRSSCLVIIANKFSPSLSSYSIHSIIFIRFLTSGKSSTHWSHKQTAGA